MKKTISAAMAGITLAFAAWAPQAQAEAREIRIAEQYGIGYLQLFIIRHEKLIEKHAKADGLGDVKVTWTRFAGGSGMNDALLSKSLDIASGGVAPAITLWAKTHGTVKLIAAMDSMPNLLNSRDPNVKSIRDLSAKDKIAVPAVKVSYQSMILQMAAEQAFGAGQQFRFDPYTVSLSHPDALTALVSGGGEISTHFAAPPFSSQELQKPGVHTILNSYSVLGGPATFNVLYGSQAFHDQNPRLYRAFIKALSDATTLINRDKRAAARIYQAESHDKETPEALYRIVSDPQVSFTMAPQRITKYSDFLYRIGSIKQKPANWKALFFPEVHHLQGS
jgi:NitT/TauT family transport system substrate-binding protein